MVDYIDGASEFKHSGEYAYSIDFANSMLYLRDPFAVDVTIAYSRQFQFQLKQEDFTINAAGTTATINPSIFDKDSSYKFIYKIAFPIQSSLYTVSGSQILFTDAATVKELYDSPKLSGSKIKISYSREGIQSAQIETVYKLVSPIVTQILNKYTIA